MESSDSEIEGFYPSDIDDISLENIGSDISVSSVNSSDLETSDLEDELVDNLGENYSDGWQNYCTRKINIVPEFCQTTGPRHNLDYNASPHKFFHLLFDNGWYEKIAVETNRYAAEQIKKKADPRWHDVTAEEIRAYFGIQILMGIHKLPAYWCYWSEDNYLRVDAVANIMSKTRYEKVTQYLHVVNTDSAPKKGTPGYDPIAKVRPIVDKLQRNSQKCFRPGRELSVDEAMVAFKGRLGFKQYIPNKPTKWGIKVWVLADSRTGYLCNLEVYTGKDVTADKEQTVGFNVVSDLASPYFGKHHAVFCDNFFSSPALMEYLLENNTYSCGTVRVNRKNMPLEYKVTKTAKNPTPAQPVNNTNPQGKKKTPKELAKEKHPHKHMEKGGVYTKQKGSMLLVSWQDNKLVNVLSTCNQPGCEPVQRRGRAGEQVTVMKPRCIVEYNKNMGGVDKHYQLLSYYSGPSLEDAYWGP